MKLDDSVLVRIVQIIQEAMLTGTDCVDYMRLIELEKNDNDKLIMTQTYTELVEKEHQNLLEFAQKQKAANMDDDSPTIVIDD